MNDQEFLAAFEAGTLSAFPHREHIRMAWLYLRRDGWEQGTQHIREGIQRLAAAKGAASKYHETMTLFWAHVVNHALQQTPASADFDGFVITFDHLLDTQLIKAHYSGALLGSEKARHAWVLPDLEPLPVHFVG